jgi:hypothetical protein
MVNATAPGTGKQAKRAPSDDKIFWSYVAPIGGFSTL